MRHKEMLEFMKSRDQAKNAILVWNPNATRFTMVETRPFYAGPYDAVLAEANGIVKREFPNGIGRDSYADPSELRSFYIAAGFTILGYGHFSIALAHPSLAGKCIKLSVRKEDSGAAYAAYCRANDGNPHLPKILHIENMSHCVGIVMPLYRQFKSDHYLPDAQFVAAQNSVLGVRTTEECAKAGVDVNSAMWKTGRAIRKYFDGLAQFDMHAGNVMWDGDTLVITDPVSFKRKE